MFTRCFERGQEGSESYEVINISNYGFEYYVNNRLERTGLVEDLERDVESLIEEGFEEVIQARRPCFRPDKLNRQR